jgi:hypothetical protein
MNASELVASYWLERRALGDAEALQDDRERTEARERGLKQVRADKSRQQQPIGAHQVRKREGDKDHRPCEGHYCAI